MKFIVFVSQVRLYKVQGGGDGEELGLEEVASISGSYEVASDQSGKSLPVLLQVGKFGMVLSEGAGQAGLLVSSAVGVG